MQLLAALEKKPLVLFVDKLNALEVLVLDEILPYLLLMLDKRKQNRVRLSVLNRDFQLMLVQIAHFYKLVDVFRDLLKELDAKRAAADLRYWLLDSSVEIFEAN